VTYCFRVIRKMTTAKAIDRILGKLALRASLTSSLARARLGRACWEHGHCPGWPWPSAATAPTHTYRGHQSSLICFLHSILSVQFTCLTVFFQVFFGLPLDLHPPLHTPYISSPSHSLLFAAHAHTITTCFAVVPRLYHLILVSQLCLVA